MATNSNLDILDRARKHMAESALQVEYRDGIPYFTFGKKDVASLWQTMRTDQLRHTDIITSGFPRSGNHWLFEIIHMVLHHDTKYADVTYLSRHLEGRIWSLEKKLKDMSAMTDPRMLTSHFRVSRLSNEIAEKGVKVIYILRNPKDVLCSWYKLMTSHRFDRDRFHGTWEEFFELSLTGEVPYGSWFDHVLDIENFRHAHPSVPVHVVQYERMIVNPEAEIKLLCNFLGQQDDRCADIARSTQIETMKVATAGKMADFQKEWLAKDSLGYIVKGKVGAWKKQFSVDQSERFDKKFEERMKESKIADMVREYIKS